MSAEVMVYIYYMGPRGHGIHGYPPTTLPLLFLIIHKFVFLLLRWDYQCIHPSLKYVLLLNNLKTKRALEKHHVPICQHTVITKIIYYSRIKETSTSSPLFLPHENIISAVCNLWLYKVVIFTNIMFIQIDLGCQTTYTRIEDENVI